MTYLTNDQSSRGLVVLRRVNYFADARFRPRLVAPSVDLSVSQILTRYRGIEGEPWPLEEELEGIHLSGGLASLYQLKDVVLYFKRSRELFLCDPIYLKLAPANIGYTELPRAFSFCGFDYGMYQSAFNLYSAVFNEVIFGRHPETRAFGRTLNEHLLLPSADAVRQYERVRQHLVQGGVDLEVTEEGETFAPMAVYHVPAT